MGHYDDLWDSDYDDTCTWLQVTGYLAVTLLGFGVLYFILKIWG